QEEVRARSSSSGSSMGFLWVPMRNKRPCQIALPGPRAKLRNALKTQQMWRQEGLTHVNCELSARIPRRAMEQGIFAYPSSRLPLMEIPQASTSSASTATSDTLRALNERIQQASSFVDLIDQEMQKSIVGQKDMVQKLLVALLADGHIMLEGMPGLAKTLAIKTLSEVVDVDFSRVQFTPD